LPLDCKQFSRHRGAKNKHIALSRRMTLHRIAFFIDNHGQRSKCHLI